ncbi:hypothetical protein L9G74_06390 [Shewanella sp. C32]|uniref:Uncharacterized protein n=1 Tax=Shewanella electrica TaxID=515560 RepID=A0ABT2FI99_9GAMM|nr:hypothetical protein [Shewanella electrica]MCH1924159.1 hypothetical protein [Shewanella electrica]MCS4556062.1 hypothetical protein [Shewanella electrica]
MPTINEAYINALLADATYALDENVANGLTGTALSDYLDVRIKNSYPKLTCYCRRYNELLSKKELKAQHV